ncbi:MAG: HAD family hydrolase [Thermoplasmata archaeon]
MTLKIGDTEFRGFLFDLDDTLLPTQTLAAWQWAWRPRGPPLSGRHALAVLRRAQHRWDRRRWRGLVGVEPAVDLDAYRQHLRETLWAIAGHPLSDPETEAVVTRFLRPMGDVERYDDALPCVERLRSAGVKVGIATELPRESARWMLHRSQLPEELLVLAGDDSPETCLPGAAAFRLALDRIQAPPSEAVFVGDLFWSDVRAATRLGISAVLLDRNGTWPKVGGQRIRSLRELESALAAAPVGDTGNPDPPS